MNKRKNEIPDILRRFESNTATAEDISWALPILRRYYQKSQRIATERKIETVEQHGAIDFTKTPILIKQMCNIRLIIKHDFIILEVNEVVLATKKCHKYYCVKRYDLKKEQYNEDIRNYNIRVELHIAQGGKIKDIDKPILPSSDYNIDTTQLACIKKFLGKNKPNYFSLKKFQGAVESLDLSDSITVSYSKRQSSLFWSLTEY